MTYAFNAIMSLSRASTRGSYSRIEGVTAFTVSRLTGGVSNKVQMAQNLTGGLPVVYQGRLENLGPFQECLTPAHNKTQKGNTGGHRSVGFQNGQRGKCSDA